MVLWANWSLEGEWAEVLYSSCKTKREVVFYCFVTVFLAGTRTCLQLLLDKEEVLLWQEVSLACLPCLLHGSSLTPAIVSKVVSNGVNFCTTSWLALLQ